jgi:hypothetical protein
MPDNLVEDLLPVYSGKVVITGSNGESLSVPYLGEFSIIFYSVSRSYKKLLTDPKCSPD